MEGLCALFRKNFAVKFYSKRLLENVNSILGVLVKTTSEQLIGCLFLSPEEYFISCSEAH
jgi:hypothetical protein